MAVMAWIVSMSGIVGPWRQDRRERRVLCLGAVVLGVGLELVGGEGLSLRLRVVCVGECGGVVEVGGCSWVRRMGLLKVSDEAEGDLV